MNANDRREPLARDSALYLVQVDAMRDRLAKQGDYPVGMSLCEVAGMNGDAADGCPFYGMDFCHCDPPRETDDAGRALLDTLNPKPKA